MSIIDRDQIRDRLRKARIAAGYNRRRGAAEHFGWAYSTVTSHENGDRDISHDMINTYAQAYGVNPNWILAGSGEEPQSPQETALQEEGVPFHRRSNFANIPVLRSESTASAKVAEISKDVIGYQECPPNLAQEIGIISFYVPGNFAHPRYSSLDLVFANPNLPASDGNLIFAAQRKADDPENRSLVFGMLAKRDGLTCIIDACDQTTITSCPPSEITIYTPRVVYKGRLD